MGTNYYLHKNTCPCCKRAEETLHIGKSSFGWCFILHVIPDDDINDLEQWEELFRNHPIFDEYGDCVTAEGMMDIITNRSGPDRDPDYVPMGYKSYDGFLRQNHAIVGPNNLLRAELGSFCIKHGRGTWDCVTGEFS